MRTRCITNVSCVNHFSLSKVMFRRLDILDAIFVPSNISIKDLGCLHGGTLHDKCAMCQPFLSL